MPLYMGRVLYSLSYEGAPVHFIGIDFFPLYLPDFNEILDGVLGLWMEPHRKVKAAALPSSSSLI